MKDPTITQIIKAMPGRFNPEAAGDMDAVIQFRLSGEEGGDYFAVIREKACTLTEGLHEAPSITLRMSAGTYVDMVMGRLTGQHAFFTRKLTYSGDISLAIRLHRLFTAAQTA